MKNQKFGMELEFTGIKRGEAIKAVNSIINGTTNYVGGTYRTYECLDNEGRTWKVMRDSSIQVNYQGRFIDSDEYQCEFVTPICRYEDIETVQAIVRALRAAGAKVNDSCGIHVHIDAADHTAKSLRNLANIMASKETLLFKALQVPECRTSRWCRPVSKDFLEVVNKKKPTSMSEIENEWYNGQISRHLSHYDTSRYHALNLHAVWQKGTVEFRLFNSTLHAGKVKAYIQLCLAISNQAKTQRSASATETTSSNERYTFRTWLLRLGMIGDEFKTAREHLLANLQGDSAWKDNRRQAA